MDSVAPAFYAFPGLSSSGSQRLGRTLPECGTPFPSAASGSGSQRLRHTLPRYGAPFPSAAPARAACGLRLFRVSEELASSRDPPGGRCRPSRISGILQIGTGGLFAVWEGVASLGLSLPLSPPPCLLPPAGMGRLFSAFSQSLCFANRRRCVPAG